MPNTVLRPAPLGAYRTPGVRREYLEASSAWRLLEGTDITGFCGIAQRGPLHRPVAVDSWEGFCGVFGAHLAHAYLAYTVQAFFAGGGRRCWVVRVADPARAAAAGATLADAAGHPVLRLAATSPGTWGDRISCRTEPAGPGTFALLLQWGQVTEVWRNLDAALRPGGRDPVALLNDAATGSRLVRAARPQEAAHRPTAPQPKQAHLRGGADGLETLRPAHFLDGGAAWGMAALDGVEEVALVAAPDLWPRSAPPERRPRPRRPRCETLTPAARDADLPAAPAGRRAAFSPEEVYHLQRDLLAWCEAHGDRIALLDAPQDPLTSPADALRWRAHFDSAFGALYYPWTLVVDPLSAAAQVTAVPPCGQVAGVCARTDLAVGVHKPPANEVLALAVDTVAAVDDLAHGDLNDGGVNAIRVQREVRVLGDRTLAVRLPEWRYLNVRRLVCALEKQIERETRWVVFEPNGPDLWREVDRVVRGVLEEAWQRGMLNGASREQAYTVTCDATVNPPAAVAAGRLLCEIGLNPPPPAEFVVVRIILTPAGTPAREKGESSA